MAYTAGVALLRRPQTTPPSSRNFPRLPCLFGHCQEFHQAGQNKPNIEYFNSRNHYEKANVQNYLQDIGRLREIRRQRENVETRPKPTKSARDPGAPMPDDEKRTRKLLPAISLDGVHTMVRRPLTARDEKPQVDDEDMEEWCLKPFSTIHHGVAAYKDEFPLLMTKFSTPEEKEINIKEFHTKRQSVVVADYSHGVIALTGADDEFQEFVDLFPEKHQFWRKSHHSPSPSRRQTSRPTFRD
ncbi:uncharacterized protein [Ptychodera flava]|uniref:uncharacterized protein n=1 Tax=Ptychodera flava TaxID=63121 RepID=UPI00396A409A